MNTYTQSGVSLDEMLKRKRESLGLTQAQFAEKYGFPTQHMVSHWENNRRFPKRGHLRNKLIDMLDLSEDHFMQLKLEAELGRFKSFDLSQTIVDAIVKLTKLGINDVTIEDTRAMINFKDLLNGTGIDYSSMPDSIAVEYIQNTRRKRGNQ